ncbi:splicing factor, suppressor of white-apricot homolog isoform X2 [Amborella trichopoda]|nr:splicing factor, suppressor of white-apricot homolog isoform X2 [Amborella trichopoda]|eukprot:XP_020524732.1 splicing factor, suppressor of white-apricot homolog isoform X2 [Amborella trichopoda]
MASGSYQAVPFSYGNTEASSDPRNSEERFGKSNFCPPFPMPETLVNHLPSTEKIHQIIARTALFVSERGGQSEIILRVKQGNNPTFGFLMPNHNLHPYFRYLVDHPELMVPTKDKPIPQQDDGESDMGQNQSCSVVGEGLSLLGSIYGSGEDEDGSVDAALDPRDAESAPSVEVADRTHSQPSSHILDKAGSNHLSSVSLVKEKVPLACSHASVAAVAASELYSKRKELDAKMSITIVPNKPITSSSSLLKDESLIMEPPSSVKYVIEKIVEFIVKNGKEFEAILIEQDQNSGRFPFLLPSHRYHLHYLKVLQWALEFKLSKRSNTAQPLDVDKKSVRETSRFKGANSAQGLNGSSAQVPTDLDRTEKFRMVIGGAKKESQDPPSKPSQQGVGLSVEAAAEIVLAATRGSRNNNPKTNFSKTHLDSSKATEDPGLSNSETGGSLPLSLHACGHSTSERDKSNSLPPLVSNLEKGGVSVAKAMAESAALAAASEADSSEARLSHDQKLKAERLKRAKMFAALIKAGGAHRAPVQLTLGQPILASASGHSDTLEIRSRSRGATPSFSGANALEPSKMDLGLLEETQEIESFEERKKETVQTGHEGRNDKSKKEVEENGGDSKKHRNYRRKHHEEEKNDESEEEQGEDRASKKHKRSKKKRHGRGRKGESEEEEGEVRDDKKHTHSRKEWHRRERNDQSEEEEEEVGNNKKHKHSKEKQHAGERSDGTEEEEEGEVRESKKHRHSRRKRHRREINYESGEEDEDDGDTKQDRHSKRKCHREDKRRHDAEIDEKRHKSHSTSKRTESRYRHKHHDSSEGSDGHGRKSDKHKERYRRDDDGVNLEPTVYRSGDEVEVGEKVDSMSLGGVEGGRGEAPHSEIPEDLRTKIRAMLLSTL